ncbi:hypothetical protein J7384_11200 [Endozoicomonas sp. G2_1]|nr:hypothetical protein [Endozoicomonas sp. G2_1]
MFVGVSLLINTSQAETQNHAEFLEFYPDCGFEIVDTVKHSGMIRSDFTKSPKFYISEKMKKLHQDILSKAEKNGIHFLVVKSRKLSPAYDESMRFNVTVEYLKTCSDPHKRGGKAAKFDALGQKLATFGQIKVGKNKTITFDLPHSIVRTELSDNFTVSLDGGLYGIKLGTTIDEVVKTFGTPSFWSSNQEGMEIVAYGRRHWLTFENSVLIAAKFGTSIFDVELMNHLDFDERFDDRKWKVENSVQRDDALPNTDKSSIPMFNNQSQSLLLDTEVMLENRQEEKNRRVIGFELKTNHANSFSFDNTQLSQSNNQDYLFKTLSSIGESAEIDVKPLLQSVLGKTPKKNGQQFLLIDGNTLVKASANSVTKILLSSGYVDGASPTWHFGPFYAGQSLDDALAVAGDSALHMLDVIEIEHNRFTMKLFASEEANGVQIYAMEVSIY